MISRVKKKRKDSTILSGVSNLVKIKIKEKIKKIHIFSKKKKKKKKKKKIVTINFDSSTIKWQANVNYSCIPQVKNNQQRHYGVGSAKSKKKKNHVDSTSMQIRLNPTGELLYKCMTSDK